MNILIHFESQVIGILLNVLLILDKRLWITLDLGEEILESFFDVFCLRFYQLYLFLNFLLERVFELMQLCELDLRCPLHVLNSEMLFLELLVLVTELLSFLE